MLCFWCRCRHSMPDFWLRPKVGLFVFHWRKSLHFTRHCPCLFLGKWLHQTSDLLLTTFDALPLLKHFEVMMLLFQANYLTLVTLLQLLKSNYVICFQLYRLPTVWNICLFSPWSLNNGPKVKVLNGYSMNWSIHRHWSCEHFKN